MDAEWWNNQSSSWGYWLEGEPTSVESTVTHLDGNEVHAMNDRDYSMMILPMPSSEGGMSIEAGQKIMWQEALGRYIIIRDHLHCINSNTVT